MNTQTLSPLATVAAIDWQRGYFTHDETRAMTAFQNPFRLARLKDDLRAVRRTADIDTRDFRETARKCKELFAKGHDLHTALRGIEVALGYEIEQELAKPAISRAHWHKTDGQDDAWQVAVLLTREGARLFPTEEACANLWSAWGFSPEGTRMHEEYSPSGRMFARSLSVRVCRNGCALLSQSGARDV